MFTLLTLYAQAKANPQQKLLPVDKLYIIHHEKVRIELLELQEPWLHIWKGVVGFLIGTFDGFLWHL